MKRTAAGARVMCDYYKRAGARACVKNFGIKQK